MATAVTKPVNGTCPHCGKDIILNIPVDHGSDPCDLAPVLAADGLRPAGNIFVYKISSEQIKAFLLDKIRQYSANAKLELVPKYCERKKRKENEPHHSYASFRVAFSEDLVKKSDDGGWFSKLGDGAGGRIQFIDTKLDELVARYQYKKRDIDRWLKSYKNLEELENAFGMTEAYIADLRNFSTPQRIKSTDRKDWIIFAASPEAIIRDMLMDGGTHQPIGRMTIMDVYPISKEVVEFTVYVQPKEIDVAENRHVRQILAGDEKLKK